MKSALHLTVFHPGRPKTSGAHVWGYVAMLAATASSSALATCWNTAAELHGVSARLLYAIARVESGLNPHAVNRSHQAKTASYDIGLMQINSRHLPRLSAFGVREIDLYDTCVNLQVGAWLLADLFGRHGASWDSVGAYNASCSQLRGEACTRARTDYAWKVYRHLPDTPPPPAPAAVRMSSTSFPRTEAAAYSYHLRVAP